MSKKLSIENPKTKTGLAMQPIFAGVVETHGIIVKKTQSYHDNVIYDIVGMGLWFLKAKATLKHGQFEDFVKSATVADLGISLRSSRNYMQAALNCGLTHRSKHSELEEMRKDKTLHGTKPTELYKLPPAKPEEEEPENEPEPQQLVLDLFRDWSNNTDTLIESRDQVDPETYEQITNQLHDALSKWTGCDWAPKAIGSVNDAEVLEDDQDA